RVPFTAERKRHFSRVPQTPHFHPALSRDAPFEDELNRLRLGGDEFGLLTTQFCPGCEMPERAREPRRKVALASQSPVDIFRERVATVVRLNQRAHLKIAEHLRGVLHAGHPRQVLRADGRTVEDSERG